jgi:hypothetical protein
MPAQLIRRIVIKRAGVRLLVGDAKLRQQLKQLGWLNFEFPSQLVDSDLTHKTC